jgi:hypothetical protein
VVLLYSAFRDASWIFQNQSIYRNLVIGLAVYYVVAGVGALAALTYYGFTDPNRLPQTVSIALILVSYAVSAVYSFFLFRALSLMADASGIRQFKLSAMIFVISALVPAVSGYLLLNDIHTVAIAGAYGLLAIAFYPEPSMPLPDNLREQPSIPSTEPTDMTGGLPLGEKYLGGFTSGRLNKEEWAIASMHG